MTAPDAPTDTTDSGLSASDMRLPQAPPTTKSAKNHRRPAMFSSMAPARKRQRPFIARWATLPWSSVEEKIRYHSPDPSTSVLFNPPSATSVSMLGASAPDHGRTP